MVTLDDVATMALDLAEVTEGKHFGHRSWSVNGKTFAWERPYSKADLKRFGELTPPGEPVLAVRVEDLSEKEAALAANPTCFFTIAHFHGFAAVLIELQAVPEEALRAALLDAWLACAPRRLTQQHLRP